MKFTLVLTCFAVLAVACAGSNPSATAPTSEAPVAPAEPVTESPTAVSPSPASTAANTYTSPRYGFRFNYPDGFVVDTAHESLQPQAGDPLQSHLSIWPQAVYDAVQAGEFEGGTEYPPDASVSVHLNPNRLSLEDWAASYQPGVQNVVAVEVDGQAGISYRADGLYASDNIAVYSPDEASIILLSVSYIQEDDALLRGAFEEIVTSFQFTP